MKTKYIKYLLVLVIGLTSCEKLVDDINENPNQLSLDAVEAGLFLNGAELSNLDIQLGYLNRMAGYYSNQLVGFEQIELERFQYTVTSSTFNWDGYQSVIAPLREIRKRTLDNNLSQGICKVLEANVISTYSSLFGDIPYSEAVSDVEDPKFDDQISLFADLQILLQEAVSDLENAEGNIVLEDYIFNGNRVKWLETAWTLKARLYMYTKQYDEAFNAAHNGISAIGNSMMFHPLDIPGDNTTKNKIFERIANNPSTGTGNSYMIQLLDNSSSVSRNNAKTDETARLTYLTVDHTNAFANVGIAHEMESQPIITFQENLLILAEAGARTEGFNIGLVHLNELRSVLNSGDLFNANVAGLSKKYEAYVAADFNAGGIENLDSIDELRALLREIIEERYISGFNTFMPFDDARRLKKTDLDISVPFPLNLPTSTQNVERFLIPEDEALSNQNSPAQVGLYVPTKVNL